MQRNAIQMTTLSERSRHMRHPPTERFWLAVLCLTLAACTPFAPSPRSSPEGDLPRTFTLYEPADADTGRWWESFGDAELNRLVEQTLADNFTIRQAWARLRQARALAVQAGTARYPTLDLEAGTSLGRRQVDGGSSDTVESYRLGLLSNYEIDLWGRIRSETEAARLSETATREDLNASAMSVAAAVVERWANLIAQRMQLELLRRQFDTNETFLELVELRFENAMVSALDVYQQKQTVESVQAQIPLVEAEERRLLNELAVLLGRPPGGDVAITRTDLPMPDPVPAAGVPADLLAARPDIRAAGLRIEAADWQVSAARADRLPALRLTGTAAYDTDGLSRLLDSWLVQLAANLAAPLFDAGRRQAEVDRTLAVADERLWAYRETVYSAIQEVEDALMSENRRRAHIQALERQMETARNALEQAGQRYRNGLSDYLPVLTQLLSLQNLERTLVTQRAALLIDRVSLHRALGGDWTIRLEPAASSS